jgi:hypothetical protein
MMSRAQKVVTLASIDAEGIALSELSIEFIFISHELEFMEVLSSYPFETNLNIKAIYFAYTASTITRTKHINITFYFIRELVDSKKIKIKL